MRVYIGQAKIKPFSFEVNALSVSGEFEDLRRPKLSHLSRHTGKLAKLTCPIHMVLQLFIRIVLNTRCSIREQTVPPPHHQMSRYGARSFNADKQCRCIVVMPPSMVRQAWGKRVVLLWWDYSEGVKMSGTLFEFWLMQNRRQNSNNLTLILTPLRIQQCCQWGW